MSVDRLRDSANTHSQQRGGGFKGERYIKSLSVDILPVIPFAFQVTAALAAGARRIT
ncbi:hypothetical protein Rin_00006240 [Candidatus Regiella insecticola 5.15]|uniref:Uncharacterized protein n=1 Tax=Candidatus Regiella insecticola 5.15 TaxID=1005043 RepID=G2GXX8_9ENTR|nr:hypothetical protein [Candidatus Regiella insecticola]EGY29404.1 hypothetical protein Rin_00006240 [Candidatus Regiella insecticola 5.15]